MHVINDCLRDYAVGSFNQSLSQRHQLLVFYSGQQLLVLHPKYSNCELHKNLHQEHWSIQPLFWEEKWGHLEENRCWYDCHGFL